MRKLIFATIMATPLLIVAVSLFALLTVPIVTTTVCSASYSNSIWFLLIFLGGILSVVTSMIAMEALT